MTYDYTVRVEASLRGIDESFKRWPDRPSQGDTIAYFLSLYGLALRLGIDTPATIRRWAESLSATQLTDALREAACQDASFVESVSYHEGIRRVRQFPHVTRAVVRATLCHFIDDPDGDRAALHQSAWTLANEFKTSQSRTGGASHDCSLR